MKFWIDSTGNIYEGQYIMIDDDTFILDGLGSIIFSNGYYKLKGNFIKGMKHGIFQIIDLKNINESILVKFDNDIIQTDDNNNILVYKWKK